jgi:putative phage-type endonuclease
MKTETYNTRAEWLEARKRGLGGTDVAAILGASKWSSPWRVWAEKNGHEFEQVDREAMSLGRKLEVFVAQEWADRAEKYIRTLSNAAIVHPDHEWARFSPDALVAADDYMPDGLRGFKPGAIYEGKISAGYGSEWGPDGSPCVAGNVPEAYRIQLAWNLAVSGLPRGVLVCLYRGTSIREYWMDRDPELSDRLLTFAGEWWDKHVVRGEMPEVDGTADCSTALTLAAGEPDGETGISEELAGALAAYHQACAEAKVAEVWKAEEANRIRELMGPAEKATGDGWTVTWKDSAPSERVDLDKLREDFPDVYNEVMYYAQAQRRLSVRRKAEN